MLKALIVNSINYEALHPLLAPVICCHGRLSSSISGYSSPLGRPGCSFSSTVASFSLLCCAGFSQLPFVTFHFASPYVLLVFLLCTFASHYLIALSPSCFRCFPSYNFSFALFVAAFLSFGCFSCHPILFLYFM